MDRALKRRRLGSLATPSDFLDLRFLVPTPNLFERLFSKCGYTLIDRHRLLFLSNFEKHMF